MSKHASTGPAQAPALLAAVASHEESLMASLRAAEGEARATLDAAHADAATTLTDASNKLEAELADMRRTAAGERAAEVEQIERASQGRVAGIRQNAEAKLESVRAEVLRRIMPTT